MNTIAQYALTPAQRESLLARGLMHKPVPHLQQAAAAAAVVPQKKYQAKRPVVCIGVYSSHGWKWEDGEIICWRCGITKPKRKPRHGIKLWIPS